jgi:Fe-S-cluster containining protein
VDSNGWRILKHCLAVVFELALKGRRAIMSSQKCKKRREKKQVQRRRHRESRRTRPDERPRGESSGARSEAEPQQDVERIARQAEELAVTQILGEGRTKAKVIELWENAANWARCFLKKSLGHGLPCGPGCSFCCHLPVAVSAPEALGLAFHLKARFAAPELRAIRERIARNAAKVADMTVSEHARAQVKCALLDNDGKCFAYKARPIACSSWCSLSRAECEASFKDDDPATATVTIDAGMHEWGRGVQVGLSTAVFRLGLDGKTYELHSALLRALDTPDAEERWARGDGIFSGSKEPTECPRSVSIPVTGQRRRPG